jgi:hypothetical protein
MFNMPFGTAGRGEAFTYPVAAALREQLMKECPQLVPKRFEIRLCVEAGTDLKYSLLEVSADPAGTVKAENTRLSLLRLIERAEEEWTIGEKFAGIWGGTPSAYVYPVVWLEQSLKLLSDLVYLPPMIRDMNHPILQRFRKKIG